MAQIERNYVFFATFQFSRQQIGAVLNGRRTEPLVGRSATRFTIRILRNAASGASALQKLAN
jgi:hypothetical protein